MDLFETCSDAGTKSRVSTHKITCRRCGGIKSCYNIWKSQPKQTKALDDNTLKEKEKDGLVCRCDKETYYQWLKRIIGFGFRPASARESGSSKGSHQQPSTQAESCHPSHPGGSSKPLAETIEELISDIASLPEKPTSTSPAPERSSQPLEAETRAETDDQSQVSKESKSKKKKKQKRPERDSFEDNRESFVISDSGLTEAQLKKFLQERKNIPISTASVFHSYRSRIHYSFQPDKHRRVKRPRRQEKVKRAPQVPRDAEVPSNSPNLSLVLEDAQQNKQQSAAVWDNFAGTCENITTQSGNWCLHSKRLASLQSNCPASPRKSFKLNVNTLNAHSSSILPVIHRSHSNPEIEREFAELSDHFAMSPCVCSPSTSRGHSRGRLLRRGQHFYACRSAHALPPRSHSLDSGVVRRKASSSRSLYPIIFSSVTPVLRKSPRRFRKSSFTSSRTQKPASCPQIPRDLELRSDKLQTRLSDNEAYSLRGKAGSKSNMDDTSPRCFLSPRPKCRSSTWHANAPAAEIGSRNKKGLCPKAPKLDAFRQSEIDFKSAANKTKYLTCLGSSYCDRKPYPTSLSLHGARPYCSLSQASNKPGISNRLSARWMRVPKWSANRKSIGGQNVCQSSNTSISPDSTMDKKVQTAVEFKRALSEKRRGCELVLAPHCVRKMGPRSTVTEYLATIEPPKPRPRIKPTPSLKKQSGTNSKTGSSQQVTKESTNTTSKASSKQLSNKKAKISAPQADTSTKASARQTPALAAASGERQAQGEALGEPPAQSHSAANEEGKDNANNNYGFEKSTSPSRPYSATGARFTGSSSETPIRLSSVPASSYTSSLDSGYAGTDSPYFASNGMRTAYINPSYSRTSPGYLKAAQDFRKSIRGYYEHRRLLLERKSPNAVPTDARQTMCSQVRPNSQDDTWSNASRISSEKQEKKSAKQAQNKPRINVESVKKTQLENDDTSKKNVDIKSSKENTVETCVSQQPANHTKKMPTYIPRKSFLEGNAAIDSIYQDILEAEKTFDKQANNSLVTVKQLKHKEETSANALQGSAEGKMQEKAMGDISEQTAEEANRCRNKKEDSDEDERNLESEQRGADDENLAEPDVKPEPSLILNGMESSVDIVDSASGVQSRKPNRLPSTIRKVEPRGTFLKTLIAETSSTSTDATQVSSLACPSIHSSTKASDHQEWAQHDLCATPNSAVPVPVFQSLLEKFHETVQIFVRTRENMGEVSYPGDIVHSDVEDKERKLFVTELNQSNALAPREGNGGVLTDMHDTAAIANDASLALWDADKSKNRTAPSCGATSRSVSWSDVDIVESQACEKQATPSCSSHVRPQGRASPSANAAQAQLASSVPSAKASSTKTEYELEICTTTKRIYMEQNSTPKTVKLPPPEIISAREAIIGCDEAIGDLLTSQKLDTSVDPIGVVRKQGSPVRVIKPTLQVFRGLGEIGQGENLANKLAIQSFPQKACPEAHAHRTSARRPCVKEPNLGSSVDPAPDGEVPSAVQSILNTIKSSHSMFQKVSDSYDSALIMTAKSSFLRRVKGKSMTSIASSKNPKDLALLSRATLKSVANSSSALQGEATLGITPASPHSPEKGGTSGAPVQTSALTEAMKKFISEHGTPV